MTAIGFVLLVITLIYFNGYNTWQSHAAVENIYAVFGLIGFLLVICGCATWLWRVMP